MCSTILARTEPLCWVIWDIRLLTRYPKQPTVDIFILSNQSVKMETKVLLPKSVKLYFEIKLAIASLISCGICKTLFYVYNWTA